MFNISHKINNRKLTLIECDKDFKPLLYCGNCFLINESKDSYYLQMISDINFRKHVYNSLTYNFILISIPSNIPYHYIMNEIIHNSQKIKYKVISKVNLKIQYNDYQIKADSSIGECCFRIYKENSQIFISHPFFCINKNELLEKI